MIILCEVARADLRHRSMETNTYRRAERTATNWLGFRSLIPCTTRYSVRPFAF